MTSDYNPLVGPPPTEIHLRNAPLVRVIAQVRFPQILEIEEKDSAVRFQKEIKGLYPILRQEQIQGIEFGPNGMQQSKPKVAWRFTDLSGHWKVGLSSDFIALDTDKYLNRADFISRLEKIVVALIASFDPKQIDRLGIRYINRIEKDAIGEIDKLVRQEMRGIVGATVFEHAEHALSESIFSLEDDRLMARWGLLPAQGTFDPAVLNPIDTKSWILDLDMFSTKPIPFSAQRIVAESKKFSDRIYSFFRWIVTDTFIKKYGGDQ